MTRSSLDLVLSLGYDFVRRHFYDNEVLRSRACGVFSEVWQWIEI
jgi:hypothetical protein